jgi:hypothetical protein
MSLLLSESLVGVLDEQSLEEDEIPCGIIKLGKDEYEIDAFISDGKVIRIHVAAPIETALRLLTTQLNTSCEIVLGDNDFTAKGKILQVGWEKLAHGNRLVISMNVRDK